MPTCQGDRRVVEVSTYIATEGIVELKVGEYAIFHAQFRVGDGDTISKHWEALSCLETLVVPYAIWDGTSPPATLVSLLPQADKQPPSDVGRALRARFDQPAVKTYYADYLEQGKEAFVLSHFGRERLDALRRQTERLESMGMRTVRQFVQTGELDAMLASVRGAGLQDAAARLERLRARAT